MEKAITIKNLKYQYDQNQPLFDGLNLNIEQGQWVALVGHNGSGKSTLAKLILGLLVADEGEIAVRGQTLSEDSVDEIRSQIGMVFQNPDNQFVGATVADDVAFGLENLEVPSEAMPAKIQAALEVVGMEEFTDREPHHLSGGQKQRVALASVLALEPKIIILDEATAMLDPDGRQMVQATLKKLKQLYGSELTLITITHDMDEASLADRVVVVNDGQLVMDGQPNQVFAQGATLAKIGLELPFSMQLIQRLDPRPQNYMNQQELLAWLSPLNK